MMSSLCIYVSYIISLQDEHSIGLSPIHISTQNKFRNAGLMSTNPSANELGKQVSLLGSKTKQIKGGKKRRAKRYKNDEDTVTTDEEHSDNIEYDDSDNNANVAGADEADSIGEVEDNVDGIQGLQEVHQV